MNLEQETAKLAKIGSEWSKSTGLTVYDIEDDTKEFFPVGSIPEKHLWAYRHILNHDCGSISCGKTVYEITQTSVPVNNPE